MTTEAQPERENTGKQRNRRYRYDPYIALFDRQALATPEDETGEEVQETMTGATGQMELKHDE